MRVLLVESDAALASTIARGLLQASVDVAVASSIDAAHDCTMEQAFDALVVDAALPNGAAALCRELRRRRFDFVIVMLADQQSLAERVHARSVDVDACVTKPVNINELLLHLRAPGRAARSGSPSRRIVVGDLEVDFRARTVQRADRPIHLTAKEFALLEVLANNVGTVVDRQAIVAHVWQDSRAERANVLEVLVRRLRRKIDDGYEAKLVRTLRSSGYQLRDG